MRMETSIRIALMALAVTALNGCGPKAPEFEILGITLDATTLEQAQKIHPSMQCDRLRALGIRPLLADYRECSVDNVEVAKIRSSLKIEVNKGGIVTAVTIHGEPYDGPFSNFSKAMTEKYGPPQSEERGEPVWHGSNGKAVLVKTRDGGAMLLFHGNRWQQELEALKRDTEKGRKF